MWRFLFLTYEVKKNNNRSSRLVVDLPTNSSAIYRGKNNLYSSQIMSASNDNRNFEIGPVFGAYLIQTYTLPAFWERSLYTPVVWAHVLIFGFLIIYVNYYFQIEIFIEIGNTQIFFLNDISIDELLYLILLTNSFLMSPTICSLLTNHLYVRLLGFAFPWQPL